jgi:trehalose-6-phosphate synthase
VKINVTMKKVEPKRMVRRSPKQRVFAVTHLLPYTLNDQSTTAIPKILPHNAGNRGLQHAVLAVSKTKYDIVWVGIPLNAHLVKPENVRFLENKFWLKYSSIPVFFTLHEHIPYYQEFCKQV